jgi:glucose-1-phosphate thymidylyltransferase
MKGVILAAGEGTRLRPKTEEIPKPLVEVAGKPILTRALETLLDLGIDKVVIVIGYKGDQIEEEYGGSYRGLDISYARQAKRDGLAHAVLAAHERIESDFVVLNGDNVYSGNLESAIHRHASTGAEITFPVETVSSETAERGAVCDLDDNGTVIGLVEKPETPPSECVPTAFYVLPPEVLHACRIVTPSSRGEYELPDAIDLLIHAGYEVETVPFEGWRVNINTEQDVERAERKLSGRGDR